MSSVAFPLVQLGGEPFEEPTDLGLLSSAPTAPDLTATETNAKGAAREVFVWLRQLARDAGLMPLAYRVGIEISQHVDRRKGYAHPSHGKLASELGASRRGIQNALRQLQDRQHLDVTVSRGAGQANRYRLRIKTRQESGS